VTASTPGTPDITFEQMLADPNEQFDTRSEVLASILRYAAAQPATAGSESRVSGVGVWLSAEQIRGLKDVVAAREAAAEQRGATRAYDREVLVNVLVYHTRNGIQGCRCGWAELGRSWPEHVADVYEESVRVLAAPDTTPEGDPR
jgi:hypothetical protein